MNIQDCLKGLRVTHKPTGRAGTVKDINVHRGYVDIELDNGQSVRVEPAMVEPLDAAAEPAQKVPMRPCPNCAQLMHYQATVCPSCGFQYGVNKGGSGFGKTLVVLIILAAIAFAIWKFVLNK